MAVPPQEGHEVPRRHGGDGQGRGPQLLPDEQGPREQPEAELQPEGEIGRGGGQAYRQDDHP